MFNFNTLPYPCQQRFVELAKAEIILEFSNISSFTRKLCKNRKIVKNIEYSPSSTTVEDSDSLLQVNDREELKKWKNLEAYFELKIAFEPLKHENEKRDLAAVYRFDDFKMIPRSYKKLDLFNVDFEKISDVTELIGPNVIDFAYLPKFAAWEFSPSWKKELNDLFAALNKVRFVRLFLIFNREETDEEFQTCHKMIEKWRKRRSIKTSRRFPRYSFWSVAWKHGPNSNLAKIYHKTNLNSAIHNGKLSYNLLSDIEKMCYANIFEMVYIEKCI